MSHPRMYPAKRGYQPGDEPVPGYHLVKPLGKGTFGEVWQAKAPGGMQVALKFINLADQEGLKEFSGLQQVKDIRHANLVEFVACWIKTEDGQVLDELPADPVAAFSSQDSSIAIGGTMLLAEGRGSSNRPVELIVAMSLGAKTLYQRLQECNPGRKPKEWSSGIPHDELLEYIEQAAKGIDYLNRRFNIIHGDIKPQNLLIVGDSVRVCDFGLARAVANVRMTQSAMGTVAYAAPELLEGKPHRNSDQYCLAISYIELRTGSLPFREENPVRVMDLHRAGKLDLSALPGRAEREVIRRATAVKPDKRWPSCTEMVAKLREARQADERAGWRPSWWPFGRGEARRAASSATSLRPSLSEPVARPGLAESSPRPITVQTPATPRGLPTIKARHDETDSLAETLAVQPAAPPRRRTWGPSVRRWVTRVAMLGVLVGIGFGLHRVGATRWALGLLRAAQEALSRTTPQQRFLELVEQGRFDQAADILANAKRELTVDEYDRLIEHDWQDHVFRPLQTEATWHREAAQRLADAEASAKFMALVGNRTEDLWALVQRRWNKAIDRMLERADYAGACNELRDAPPKAFTHPERQSRKKAIQDHWGRQFDSLLARSDWTQAVQMLADVPPDLFEPSQIENNRKAAQQKWADGFEDQLRKGDFDGAAALLQSLPSGLFSQAELMAKTNAIRSQWADRFQSRLRQDDFEGALALLSTAQGRILDTPEQQARRKEIRDKWSLPVDALVAQGQYGEALKRLQTAPKGLFDPADWAEKRKGIQGGFVQKIDKALAAGDYQSAVGLLGSKEAEEILDAPELHQKKTAARDAWLQSIHANWKKAEPLAAFTQRVESFLAAFGTDPRSDEARLLRARACVRQGRPEEAVRDLQLLQSKPLSSDQQDLVAALGHLAKFKALDEAARTSLVSKSPAGTWCDLDDWEKERLRVPPSPSQKDFVVEASELLAQQRYAEAREALRKGAAGPAAASRDLEIRLWQAVVELRDPKAEAGSVHAALTAVFRNALPATQADSWAVSASTLPLVTRQFPAALESLATRTAYPAQSEDLAAALEWLQAAYQRFGLPEIAEPMRPLIARRLALRVFEPNPPSDDDGKLLELWDRLRRDRPSGKEPSRDELLAEAWRAECMVALKRAAPSARDMLLLVKDRLLKSEPAYGRYVWCRAMAASSQPAWDQIARELAGLLPHLQAPDAPLQAQNRLAVVAKLIAEVARQRRQQARQAAPWAHAAQIPFSPFANAEEAEQYAVLLKAAQKLAPSGADADAKASLALAAFHQPKPDYELVWSLGRQLLGSDNESLKADRLPLAYAAATSFWQQPRLAAGASTDPQLALAVRLTTELLQQLGSDQAPRIPDAQAKALYQAVVRPLLEDARFQPESLVKHGLAGESVSELCGSLAMLLRNQKDASWPLPPSMPSVFHAVENLASRAIALWPSSKAAGDQIAAYYAVRAEARAYRPDYSVDQILADADLALKYQPKSHWAHGVRGYALVLRSQQQSSREKLLKDLDEAIRSGTEAVAHCPKTHKAMPIYLANLSQAHLHRGNYEIDPKLKAEHFAEAEKRAREAAALEVEAGEDLDLTLGNTYEDIASQVGANPKESYQKALERFRQVLSRSPLSARAELGLGRCYYKALVETQLAPADLGFSDRTAALETCRGHLERAIANSGEDVGRVEAHRYLGKLHQHRGEWEQAEKNLRQAVELAKKLAATNRVAYFREWAYLPLLQAASLASKLTPEQIREMASAAEQRTGLLKQLPGFLVTKDVALIEGYARQLRGDYEGAIRAYDQALAADLNQVDPSDMPLLAARADCHLAVCRAKPGATQHAEAALRDATRSLQLSSLPDQQARAYYRAARAHFFLATGPDGSAHRAQLVENIRHAIRLVPEGTEAVRYRNDGAVWVVLAVDSQKDLDPAEALRLLQQAKKWQEEAIAKEPSDKARKTLTETLQAITGRIAQRQSQDGQTAPPSPNP